jgi:HPt (histidine-containing phosphotransfer) domain-containing protein
MSQTETDVAYIRSRLWGDVDLEDLILTFIDEMPSRMAFVRDCLGKRDWEGLRRAAHQLKGAAGGYGFEPLFPAANRVESAIRDGEPEEQVAQAVAELVDLCDRVRCG